MFLRNFRGVFSHRYNDYSIWTCKKPFGTIRRFWSLIFFWIFYRIVHRFIFDSGWSTNTKFNTTGIHQSNQWYEQRNGSSMEKRSTSENVENRYTSLSNIFSSSSFDKFLFGFFLVLEIVRRYECYGILSQQIRFNYWCFGHVWKISL